MGEWVQRALSRASSKFRWKPKTGTKAASFDAGICIELQHDFCIKLSEPPAAILVQRKRVVFWIVFDFGLGQTCSSNLFRLLSRRTTWEIDVFLQIDTMASLPA